MVCICSIALWFLEYLFDKREEHLHNEKKKQPTERLNHLPVSCKTLPKTDHVSLGDFFFLTEATGSYFLVGLLSCL